MKEFRMVIRRGEDFAQFFESSVLESAIVSSQFGKIEKGNLRTLGNFQTEIVDGGYNLSMNRIETESLTKGAYRFDILIRRTDPLQKGGFRNDIEYFGMVIVE